MQLNQEVGAQNCLGSLPGSEINKTSLFSPLKKSMLAKERWNYVLFSFLNQIIYKKKLCLRGRHFLAVFFFQRGLCLFSEVAAEVAEISSTPWSTGFCRKSSWDPWGDFSATENIHMGVSWNGGTPKKHPQNDHFLVGKPHGFVGETHHFRKHSYYLKPGVYQLPWFQI